MKKVMILIPEDAVLSSITDPRYMFTAVNQFLTNAGRPEAFQVSLVGLSKEVKLNEGLFSIHPDYTIENAPEPDLLIIPALGGDMRKSLEKNRSFLPWINARYKAGSEVCSLCVGAFLLASTGLLNGKKCSTHWILSQDFREMFPEVLLVDDRIITDEQGLYTSGGASSYWNLLLYLIEKFTDREMAILASKYFAIEIGRNTQSSFIMFRGQKSHKDEQIKKAQEYIERNFHDKITVEQLSEIIGVGRRSLERRFKKVTSNTVTEYIQRVKVEAAKVTFERSDKNVNEVMFEVGYSDNKAFRDVFKKITGMSPVMYRNKYNKDALLHTA